MLRRPHCIFTIFNKLLHPSFIFGTADCQMGVCRLHYIVVRPMRIVFQVGKLVERRQIVIDVFLIRRPAHDAVCNGYNLSAGDVTVAPETAVGVAVEPFFICSKGNVFDRPVGIRNISVS